MVMVSDKSIKRLDLSLLDEKQSKIEGKNVFKDVRIAENDVIDLIYEKDGKILKAYGELIKIGVINEKKYFTIMLYNYYDDDNVVFIYVNDIKMINNVNHKNEPLSFNKVICPDESVILLRSVNGVLQFSNNGKDWSSIGAGGTFSNEVICTALYNELKDNYNMKINSYTDFMSLFAQFMNTLVNEDSFLVSQKITDLDGHIILAGEGIL